jgi:hypothetical protein
MRRQVESPVPDCSRAVAPHMNVAEALDDERTLSPLLEELQQRALRPPIQGE